MSDPFGVLFVCAGNICRSPTADAVLRHKVLDLGLERQIKVDSAGTHAYHIGDAPDPRSVATAWKHGVNMLDLRARKVSAADFQDFDWLVAMDGGHHQILDRLAVPGGRGQVVRVLDFLGDPEGDVPDPYYGSGDGFAQVYDMVDRGCNALLERLKERGIIPKS